MAKGKTVWLARDNEGENSSYVLFPKMRPVPKLDTDGVLWEQKVGEDDAPYALIGCGSWDDLGGPKLKPGEGPIKVRISIEKAG